MKRYIRTLTILARIYASIALLAAAIISPSVYSVIPLLLLAWYLALWFWRMPAFFRLITHVFLIFAVPILFSFNFGLYLAALTALPLLFLLNIEQTVYAVSIKPLQVHPRLRISWNYAGLWISIFGALLIALVASNATLAITAGVTAIYLVIEYIYVRIHTPAIPMEAIQTQQRLVAGKKGLFLVKILPKTTIKGNLYLKPAHEWITITPESKAFDKDTIEFEVTVTPSLSGPMTVKLNASTIDRWGIMPTFFDIEPISLVVIPRARYAEWLAKKYLAGTRPGDLPLLANVGMIKPLRGMRRGVEYYGNRLYQPGDSVKTIDWKHSYKTDELISKEFTEFQGQSAVILINLEASSIDDMDKLAYIIVVTAISLAQEDIPAAFAVYNQYDVLTTTPFLKNNELLLNSLRVIKNVGAQRQSFKYLYPLDIVRLRNNISQASNLDTGPAKALSALLSIEYQNFVDNALSNPCSKALMNVSKKISRNYSLVVISQRNHDAEALEYHSLLQKKQGNAVINVM